MVEDVDEALWGEVNVESEVDEGGVHYDGKPAFALLYDRLGKHGFVVANRSVVAVLEVRLEVCFRSTCVAKGWGAGGEDAVEVRPDVGVNDGFELGEEIWCIYVSVGVVAADPANNGGDIAIKVKKASGGHRLPVFSDGGDAFPVGLEALQGAEVDARVFFEQLLELSSSVGSTLEVLKVTARDEAAFENREENMAEAFFGVERLREQGILAKGLVELDLNAGWEDGASEHIKLVL